MGQWNAFVRKARDLCSWKLVLHEMNPHFTILILEFCTLETLQVEQIGVLEHHFQINMYYEKLFLERCFSKRRQVNRAKNRVDGHRQFVS